MTFRNESSEVTESVEWSFPGARPETSTEENPSVAFPNEGTYTVTLRAKNSEGEDVATKKNSLRSPKKRPVVLAIWL
ncbi:PKD domain-containing protein [Paenibacillus larvae]|uniref:PKD domain-containing protein n=1 Tax=Paenibacillus larvae TaxID=1464 RepID=UPI0028BEC360|nr:PKD domain-containing protein [Paenibacillus larvae]